VKNKGYFNKKDRGWLDSAQPFLLSIEDPNDEENDVGHSSFRIMTVRTAFAFAHDQLAYATSDPYHTMLSRILIPDPALKFRRPPTRPEPILPNQTQPTPAQLIELPKPNLNPKTFAQRSSVTNGAVDSSKLGLFRGSPDRQGQQPPKNGADGANGKQHYQPSFTKGQNKNQYRKNKKNNTK